MVIRGKTSLVIKVLHYTRAYSTRAILTLTTRDLLPYRLDNVILFSDKISMHAWCYSDRDAHIDASDGVLPTTCNNKVIIICMLMYLDTTLLP